MLTSTRRTLAENELRDKEPDCRNMLNRKPGDRDKQKPTERRKWEEKAKKIRNQRDQIRIRHQGRKKSTLSQHWKTRNHRRVSKTNSALKLKLGLPQMGGHYLLLVINQNPQIGILDTEPRGFKMTALGLVN